MKKYEKYFKNTTLAGYSGETDYCKRGEDTERVRPQLEIFYLAASNAGPDPMQTGGTAVKATLKGGLLFKRTQGVSSVITCSRSRERYVVSCSGNRQL